MFFHSNACRKRVHPWKQLCSNKHPSLRLRLVGIGLAIWTAAAAGFVTAAVYVFLVTYRDQTLQTLESAARLHAAHATRLIALVTDQVEAVAGTARVRAMLDGQEEPDDAAWLLERIIHPVLEIESLTVIAPNGMVVADSRGKAMARRQELMTPPVARETALQLLDSANGEPASFAITVPVHTANANGALGWLRARVLLGRIDSDLMEPMGIGSSEETYLVDGQGRVLTPRKDPDPEIGSVVTSRSAIPIPQLDLTLVAELQTAEMLVPLRRLVWVSLILGAAFSLAGGVAAYGLLERLLRPLGTLHRAAVAMATGQSDIRVPVERQDELGALASAFNQMSDAVASALAQERAERAFNEKVVASVPSGLVVLSREMEVLLANGSFRELVHLPHSPLTGQPIDSILPAVGLREAAVEVLATGVPVHGVDVPYTGGQGRQLLHVGITGLRRAEEEEEEEVLLIVDDVTDRWRSETARQFLYELDRWILRTEPEARILAFICTEVRRLYDCPLVWMGRKGQDGSIAVTACAGAGSEWVRRTTFRWDDTPEGNSLPGLALRTHEPQAGDLTVLSDGSGIPSELPHLRSALAVPLIGQGEELGVLVLHAAGSEIFPEPAVRALTALAGQMALSLLALQNREQIHLQTAALQAAGTAVVITDPNGVIQYVNPAFTQLTGYTAQEAVGQTPRLLNSSRHKPRFFRRLWETILTGKVWRGELHNRRKNGSLYISRQVIAPVHAADGIISHFVTVSEDITEQKGQEARIQHQATHDFLTELPNRYALEANLRRTVARSRRGPQGALLLLDLDNFKVVNDTAGHPTGDRLLIAVAQLLTKIVRHGDLLARLGGDEFAVLLETASAEEAPALAERLRQAVDEFRYPWGAEVFAPTTSIGVAVIDGNLDFAQVLSLADAALYAAKDQGGNRVVLYRQEEEKGTKLAEEHHWVNSVKNALREERLVLFYQPIVHLADGQPLHFEALIRMRDETGALIGPAHFIPIAERFGLMPQVDRWVVKTALHFLRMQPHLHLFVNLSASGLEDQALIDYVENAIQESKVPPHRLGFEITETAAMRNMARAQEHIGRLKQLGCPFALDDFGTGFSSIAYLHNLPVDYVKVEGSITRNIENDPTQRALVHAIVSMAHALNKKVIVEMVEREETAEVLRSLGVQYGQGYLWGRPNDTV